MLLTSASARTERNDGQRADACFHQRRVGCLVEFTLDYIENSVVGVRGNILVPVDNLDHCERLAPHRRRLHPIDKVRTREISRTACALSLSSRWCKSKDSTTTSHVPLSNGNARTSARSTTAFCSAHVRPLHHSVLHAFVRSVARATITGSMSKPTIRQHGNRRASSATSLPGPQRVR